MTGFAKTILVPSIIMVTPIAAMASPVQELHKEINVVGLNESTLYVAVKEYETLVKAKIAEKPVTIWFDDSDCIVDQVQLQVD